jgi:hypothetical protein
VAQVPEMSVIFNGISNLWEYILYFQNKYLKQERFGSVYKNMESVEILTHVELAMFDSNMPT